MSIATEDGEAVQEQIQARLEALRKELETGQAELRKVEAQRTYLHETYQPQRAMRSAEVVDRPYQPHAPPPASPSVAPSPYSCAPAGQAASGR